MTSQAVAVRGQDKRGLSRRLYNRVDSITHSLYLYPGVADTTAGFMPQSPAADCLETWISFQSYTRSTCMGEPFSLLTDRPTAEQHIVLFSLGDTVQTFFPGVNASNCFYANRLCDIWNSLPETTVEASRITVLDDYCSVQC